MRGIGTLLMLAAAVLLTSATVSAAGFDLTGAGTEAPGIATGHSDIITCNDHVEVAFVHVLVASDDQGPGQGQGQGQRGGQQWMVDGVDVVGPEGLATACDGWRVTVAVELKDGSAVVTATAELTEGAPLPFLALDTQVPKSEASGTSVLLTPVAITVPLNGDGS